jgi:hypothetical protein
MPSPGRDSDPGHNEWEALVITRSQRCVPWIFNLSTSGHEWSASYLPREKRPRYPRDKTQGAPKGWTTLGWREKSLLLSGIESVVFIAWNVVKNHADSDVIEHNGNEWWVWEPSRTWEWSMLRDVHKSFSLSQENYRTNNKEQVARQESNLVYTEYGEGVVSATAHCFQFTLISPNETTKDSK